MTEFKDKTILVTGGTGSFGQKFTSVLLNTYPDIKKLIIFSRDELKQYEMALAYPKKKYDCIRFFLGDVRDGKRLQRAFENVDIVVHAAALKQVPAAEYNPMEFIKTNIIGAENVINAAIDCQVKKVIALSTDKAAAPVNLYGATKLCSDKLFVAANNFAGGHDITFCVVRYGNVMGSRGSVIPYFLEKKKSGVLPITDKEMTRFNISLEEGVELVLFAVRNALGGEIFVPKIPSYRIGTVAEAICPDCKIEYVGIRPGEKLHEEMITESDSFNTIEMDKYFAILPENAKKEKFLKHYDGHPVKDNFRYSSKTNNQWIDVDEMKSLIKKYVDPTLE